MAALSARFRWLVLTVLLSTVPAVSAQTSLDDPPKVLKADPSKTNPQVESLKQYALGLLCEQEDRLLEALQAYEKAAELDPKALPVQKKLLAFYTALDRGKDALAVCEKILELDAKDAKVWHLYAQQLQNQSKAEEAVAALKKGLKCLNADMDLDLAQQMYFDLGNGLADLKQPLPAAAAFRDSAKLLKKALRELPLEPAQQKEIQARLVLLYERAGKIYLDAHEYDKAIAAYKEAEQSDPLDGTRWQLNLAQIYREQGKWAAALNAVDLYLKSQPPGVEGYELKIALLEKLDRSKDILPWLSQAAKNDKFNVNLRLLLAEQYDRQGQPGQAVALYLDLAKENPKTAIYSKLLQAYKKGNNLVKALELINQKMDQVEGKDLVAANQAKLHVTALRAALQADPALAQSLVKIGLPLLNSNKALNPHTMSDLAALADQNNNLKEAEAFYKAALKKLTPPTESTVYAGLLRVLAKQKKYAEVIALCQEGLQNAQLTNQLLFYRHLANAYARQNKMDQALAQAKKAVEIAPDSQRLDTQVLYVDVLIKSKQFDKAEAECQKLLIAYKQPGEITAIRFVLSNLYAEMANFPKAEKELQLILKADPTNAQACNNLGYFWADQGKNLKEAEELIRKALDLERDQRQTFLNPKADPDQDSFTYVDSLGWVLFRQGKLEEARKELERARKLPGGDQDPVVADHLGDVYYKLSLVPQAQACWEKALALYEDEGRPSDQHYQDLKEKIQQLKSTNP
jgi:tetratricopeptide (TPR) repeat protein